MAIEIGTKIPEILGINQDGKELKASDFAGEKLIIYFYPRDNTPGCTAEACNFRDNFSEFRKLGYKIVGVSTDSEKSHQKFIAKHELPFELIADVNQELANQFGVWGEKTLAGRKYMGIFRSTFLIDENGEVEAVYNPKEIKTKTHGEQLLENLNTTK